MKIPRLIIALTVLLGAVARGQAAPSTQPILLGCWQQIPANFDTWKARGVTVMVGIPTGQNLTPESFQLAAEAHGVQTVRPPSTMPSFDLAHPPLMYQVPDEPNLTVGAANLQRMTPAQVQELCDQYHALTPKLPVFASFAADHFFYSGDAAYFAGPDVIVPDWYPRGRNKPINFIGGPRADGKLAEIPYVQSLAPTKTVGAFIETCNQQIGGTGPTADDESAEIGNATLHGAKMLIYFSIVPGGQAGWPASFDATPPDVAARITTADAALAAYWSGNVMTTPAPPPFDGTAAYNNISAAMVNLSAAQAQLAPTTKPSTP